MRRGLKGELPRPISANRRQKTKMASPVAAVLATKGTRSRGVNGPIREKPLGGKAMQRMIAATATQYRINTIRLTMPSVLHIDSSRARVFLIAIRCRSILHHQQKRDLRRLVCFCRFGSSGADSYAMTSGADADARGGTSKIREEQHGNTPNLIFIR